MPLLYTFVICLKLEHHPLQIESRFGFSLSLSLIVSVVFISVLFCFHLMPFAYLFDKLLFLLMLTKTNEQSSSRYKKKKKKKRNGKVRHTLAACQLWLKIFDFDR